MGAACFKEEQLDFDGEVELMHFNLLRSVGKGAFGKVRVVQHKQTNDIYALKYINKQKCIKMKAVENIIQERRLLEEIECPFVCNLKFAFQDDENLFMVLDLMLGGDLRFQLDRMGTMKEEQVKFYIAELGCALDHLHERRIVHRDIKPDNILLDEFGHVHLTDFNIAVHYRPDKPLTAVAGSMAYMAPEVLAKKGYFDTVDWWSLGVVMYELLFGKRPFRAKTNEQLTHTILNEPVNFPESARSIVSAECLDVITQLLDRDIYCRLGTTESGGFERLKNHAWWNSISPSSSPPLPLHNPTTFSSSSSSSTINALSASSSPWDWEKLKSKKARPIFVPDSKKANFDATHELEELLLEDNPLKVKPRKKRCEGDEAKYANLPNGRYLQAMETKFLVYDHTKPRGYRSYLSGQMPMRPVSMIASTPALVTPSSNNTFAGSGGSGGGGGPSSSASSRQQTSFPPQLSHQHQPPPSTQHQTHQPSTIGYNNTTSSSRPILPSSTGPTANNFHSSPSSSPSSSFNNLHLTNMSLVPPPRSYSQDSRFKVNHLTSMHKDVMEGRDSEVDKDVVDEGVDSIVDDYFLK